MKTFCDTGKAYSGLTDGEINYLTDFFTRHTIKDWVGLDWWNPG